MATLTQAEAATAAADRVSSAPYYICVAYDTALIISDNDDDVFHSFDIFDRTVLWINPVNIERAGAGSLVSARAIIPCGDVMEGVFFMNRLASLLCYSTGGTPIVVTSHGGTGVPSAIVAEPQRVRSGLRYTGGEIDALNRHVLESTMSDDRWPAITHYRQGIIAATPYYEFLSYWKILELRHGKQRPAMTITLANFFMRRPEQAARLHGGNKAPTAKMWTTRNRCAHVAVDNKKGYELQDPDDPQIYLAAQLDAPVLRLLVEELLASWT